jgi:xylan 1,4-beta-xylosidase
MRISRKHMMERRVGLFPAGFDDDGVLFCNTSFGDYPKRIPDGSWDPWKDSATGWMLLSYRKPVEASSSSPEYPAENAVDEDIRTIWSTESGDKERWFQVDLGEHCSVEAIQVNFAEFDCVPPSGISYQYTGPPTLRRTIEHGSCLQYELQGSGDGTSWEVLADKSEAEEDLPHDFIRLKGNRSFRFIRVVSHNMPFQGRFALSGLRVFGCGQGQPPKAVNEFQACRLEPMTAKLSWQAIEGASGYNVRWGIAPDKLYSSWMVYAQSELEIGALTDGTEYWVAVDAFNENGVTEGRAQPIVQ